MSDYSLKEFLKKEPAQISIGVVAVLNVAVLLGLPLDERALAAIDLALVGLLNLFYIRPLTASKAALEELAAAEEADSPRLGSVSAHLRRRQPP